MGAKFSYRWVISSLLILISSNLNQEDIDEIWRKNRLGRRVYFVRINKTTWQK